MAAIGDHVLLAGSILHGFMRAPDRHARRLPREPATGAVGNDHRALDRNPSYRPPSILHAFTWAFLDGPMSRVLGNVAAAHSPRAIVMPQLSTEEWIIQT